MKLLKSILFSILFLAACLTVSAEGFPNFKFRHYTVEDGLSVNTVTSIIQDSRGMMWFATSTGLNSYDGITFRKYIPDGDELGVEKINDILTLAEAPCGKIIVGTIFGLHVFDPETESFTYFTVPDRQGSRLQTPVYDIRTDNRRGEVWVATSGQGVFKIDASIFDFDSFDKVPEGCVESYNTSGFLPNDNVRSIYIDSSERVWVLTFSDKFGYITPDRASMNVFTCPASGQGDRFDVMFEEKEDIFWIGSYYSGLYRFDAGNGEYESYFSSGTPDYLDHIRGICRYSEDVLLIASEKGLTQFDMRTKRHRTLGHSVTDYFSLNDMYVHSVFIDRERGLWVGTYFGGVNYSSPVSNNFRLYSSYSQDVRIAGNIVSVVAEDSDGNLWIGTDDAGVVFYDRKTGRSTQYAPGMGRNSISYHNIHAVCCDGDDVWVGTYSAGIDVINRRTGKIRHYDSVCDDGSVLSKSIYSIYKDSNGFVWTGTPEGCFIWDRESDSFNPVETTAGADVNCIVEDGNGYLWLSSYNRGVFRLDLHSGEWKRYSASEGEIPSDVVTTVSKGSDGRLWIGTDGNGLALFDVSDGTFSKYGSTVFDGLTIHKIIEYGECLWVSTNNGIVRMYRKTGDWKIYDVHDGIQGKQFRPNSGLLTSDGRLLFGGIKGLNEFRPTDLFENTVVPSVYISGLSLFGKPVKPGDGSGILDKEISYVDEVVLKYKSDVIGLDFASLSYAAPGKNRYMYKLEGFDEEWISVLPGRTVTYTNLSPGKYTFMVKASNNDLLWNENGAKLKIRILPPWWLSTVAIIFYILLSLLLICLGILLTVKRIRKINADTLARYKLDKEKELYESKLSFFTNVIHEIRTPLTLIAGPIEHTMKNTRGLSESVKADLSMIQRNSRRLLTIVNQLLDFRKAESGTVIFNPQDIDISLLIKQIFLTFMPLAGQRNIELKLNLPDEKILGKTDQDFLDKIVSNLLSNAIKFTRDEIVLDVTTVPEDGNNSRLQIRCDDNGAGVPEEEKEKIFNPFYQIRSNQPKDGAGSGVGLSLLNRLVTLLGGFVTVNRSEAGGASFFVSIPFERVSSGVIAAPVEETVEECAKAPETDGAVSDASTIMVVDDNSDMLEFISARLSDNYNVVTFDNASDALAALDKVEPQLVISDVMMGGMDGFEFCSRIKNTLGTCHIQVILLTAKVDMDSKIEGLNCGADVYIEKPFSIEYMSAQIHSLLLNRKKLQERFASQPSSTVASLASSKADTAFLKKVNEYIDENLREVSFTAGDIATYVGMSRSAFFAKLRAVTGQTPSDYVRIIRLKRAVKYFNEGETRINEVCYMTGFNSPSYFSKCFFQQFGEVPTAYVKRINGES